MDRILEEVQRGLDSPYKREIQRLLGVARLLGEMYNYAAVSSALVFELLYHLINFGHDVPPTASKTPQSVFNHASIFIIFLYAPLMQVLLNRRIKV